MSINVLFPQGLPWTAWRDVPLARAFAEETIDGLAALSSHILNSRNLRAFPDLVALAFWLRRRHLEQIVEEHDTRNGRVFRPLGSVLHVAPGNVDMLFMYSGVVALLAGNRNLIRLSRRRSEAQLMLSSAIASVASSDSAYESVFRRLWLVESERSPETMAALCEAIDARLLWGGDDMVRAMRSVPYPVHARELVFPDRFSLCLLSSSALLQASDQAVEDLAAAFIRDAYSFGQQACSSPRAVVWLGAQELMGLAQERFWRSVVGATASVVPVTEAELYQALAQQQELACTVENAVVTGTEHHLRRVRVGDVLPSPGEFKHRGGGLFLELGVSGLNQVTPSISPAFQTLTYWGVERQEILQWLEGDCVKGIDRVAPVGQALVFDVFWDGLDLVAAVSRITS